MIGSFNDICRELYEAREQLDARGKRPNGRSWGGYLSDVGLADRTVRRWLEHYEPAKIDSE